ncbi:MAG TPA: DEAD/DEAH box helicase family protein [Cytophagaceae bacterium]|nr:DEAD/DEAH box helicase family protein [Cytophagaceae bacterium]
MELKSYQKKVIEDLEDYLGYVQHYKNPVKAYDHYWHERLNAYGIATDGLRSYINSIPTATHVCIKVPTAGGKTFIACNALHSIFNTYPIDTPKAVVWLVPWSNLLDQTIASLRNPDHPYRQKLNSLFHHRIEVYEKSELLQGTNFNPTIVKEQLSIFVMSFASLRAKNKEDRKVHQENGNLASFVQQYKDRSILLDDVDESALINVIRSLRPVVIVDESHNAESALSVEMLNNLNPSYILDLTATPKQNSNIISYVPAIELKKEHMVKLPVIVYNHHSKTEVIDTALYLQRELETLAKKQYENGGRYIRPIVLFQAQPKTADDNTTFEKIKEQLLKAGISESHIKIKTASINELKGIDLSSQDCEVRYIITINALKEGWDCPFAYILASLADKSSVVDVEQILGRVLRQPYVQPQQESLLNNSYVLTASAKFNETLENIVESLRIAGFSDKDYRAQNGATKAIGSANEQEEIEPFEKPGFNADDIFIPEKTSNVINAIVTSSIQKNQEMNEELSTYDNGSRTSTLPIQIQTKKYYISESYRPLVTSIKIPQFFIFVPPTIFSEYDHELLTTESLLDEQFTLRNLKFDLHYNPSYSPVKKLDIAQSGESEIQSITAKEAQNYMRGKPRERRAKDMVYIFMKMIKELFSIPERELKNYLERGFAEMNDEKLNDLFNERFNYMYQIKNTIEAHIHQYAEKRFYELIQQRKITAQPVWKFPELNDPIFASDERSKSLYQKEALMNNLEIDMIEEIAALPNIVFWHRNLSHGKGFYINGYKSRHYPDFILYTLSGKILLLEVKGDDRDNSDSVEKCRLGAEWEKLAGNNYHYMMVFKEKNMEGTYILHEAVKKISQL